MSHKFSAMRQAAEWYQDFNRFAGDLYPGRYSDINFVCWLAERAHNIKQTIKSENGISLGHYYTYPEIQELSDKTGDSLALSQYGQTTDADIIYFWGVAFMAQTVKILNPSKRVKICDSTNALGCSLVFGTDHSWVENWRSDNPDGVIITYINSDPYTKALSDIGSTSRNTDKIFVHAIKTNPGKKILFLSDKFLGVVMKHRTIQMLAQEGISINPDLIEIYDQRFNGYNASCQVHEPLGKDAIIVAMLENPGVEVLAHPECGCTPYCLLDEHQSRVIQEKVSFLSTEQMIRRALESPSEKFLIATEAGMIYTLRKRVPNKTFIPVSAQAMCPYMKGNNFDKFGKEREIIICNNCSNCRLNPRHCYEDDKVIHIPRWIADKARSGIEKMLVIQ